MAALNSLKNLKRPPVKDETGNVYGRLTVKERALPKYAHSTRACWLCECSCGKTTILPSNDLRSGKTRSCGCYRLEQLADRASKGKFRQTHGMQRTKEYGVWTQLKQRCYNPKNKAFADYGGRGIYVSDPWRKSFATFIADMGERPSGHSIDRIDVDGPYSKENCRWASKSIQANNKRRVGDLQRRLDVLERTVSRYKELYGNLPEANVEPVEMALPSVQGVDQVGAHIEGV